MMAACVPDQTKTTQSWSASSKCALSAKAARPASLTASTASGALGSQRNPATHGTTRSAMSSHDSATAVSDARTCRGQDAPRSLERGAAEADLVAVGVAVDHLAHTVPVPLLRGGLDSLGADALDPLIEVIDKHRVHPMA